ncbi:MAG TPA: SpoIIE family protein phosphatase [Anaerolineales bacterium]|nr:SpoIIE family protein phosphatase [Anaerolineales bacterium]
MTRPSPGEAADILIVDDNPSNLHLLAQTLGERGYRVRAVTSGARAIESVLAEPPDLILLDIRMPGMDGFEVCRQLKADPRIQDIPVLFISALDDIPDKVNAFAAGGVDYITKPFHVEEVLARTETHLALRRLTTRLEETNAKLERELRLAGKLQASFLPVALPDVPGWRLAASLQPANQTSGDFYAVIPLPTGDLGLLIADVVDKGISAALMMAMSWGLFWMYAAEYPDDPARVFSAINRSLLQLLGGEQFLTGFYGVLAPKSGQLSYVNAGHSPPIWLQSGRGQQEKLGLTGMPLGLFEDSQWDVVSVRLEPSDGLVLYTDGVTEAQRPGSPLFGADGLDRALAEARGKNAHQIVETILEAVDRHAGGATQSDDIALLVVTHA